MATYGIRDAASSFVNPVILAQKMYFAALHYAGPWGAVTGNSAFTTNQGKMITPNNALSGAGVTGSPVVIHRELQTKAGLEVRVPMLRPIDTLPKMGRQTLKGTGNTQAINFASVWIDVVRQAVKIKDGPIGEQVLKDFTLKSYANGQLRDHYARVLAYLQYSWAMYFGASYPVLNSDTYDNVAAVTAHSHPNIYAIGTGRVTSTAYPGNSTYETDVASAIEAVTAGNVFTVDKLRELNFDSQIRKIAPLYTKDGEPYRLLFMAPLVLKDFKATLLSSNYKDTVNYSYLKKENPMLSNCALFLEGFAIFDGGYSVFAASGYAGTPIWGPATTAGVQSVSDLTSFESHSTGRFANIILGDNAMFLATGSPMAFTTEEDDHQFWSELGYTIMEGAARGDSWNKDDGSTGQYIVNNGSALVLSYGSSMTM